MTDISENAAQNTHSVVEELLLDSKSSSQIERMKVLDLPCGEGAFTKRLLAKNIEVIPSDIVNILKINEDIDNFVSSDMDRPLPFDSELFTEIVCIDGIEHMVYSKEEPDLEQRKRNAAIKKAMFSNFVYYGETIIICARKK